MSNYSKINLLESDFGQDAPDPPSSPVVSIFIPVMAKDDVLSERVPKAQLADTGGL